MFKLLHQLSILYQVIGEKLSEIGSRLDYPRLNTELAQEIETVWKDSAIQVTTALSIYGIR